MDTLILFVAALSKATTFGNVVEAYKLGGEGVVKLTAKLGRATYVTDTGNLPPDPGAMSLVLLTKGLMEGLAWGAGRGFEVGGV
jgi:dihydroxyacetone kinase